MVRIRERSPGVGIAASPAYVKVAAVLMAVSLLGLLAGALVSRLPVLIVFGVLGGLALFVVVYRNPFVGIWIAFVFNLVLPQAGPSWNLGIQIAMVGETRGIHFNVHEIVMAMVLVTILVRMFRAVIEKDWQEVEEVFRSPLTIAVALYVLTSILACFVGLLNGAKWYVGLFRFVRTVFFCYIFFTLIYLVRSRRQLQVLLVTMLVCSSVVAGFGLVQKVKGEVWSREFAERYLAKLGFPESVNYVAGESSAQAYRINSTFMHPNVFGGYLVFALPFFISLLWLYRRWWQRCLLLLGLGMNVVALFYTGSRAAWTGAGCIALAYGLFGFFDRRVFLTALTVLLIIALVFVMLNPPEFIKKRFVSLSAKEAAQARIYQYSLALDFFLEHPVFGVGMGMEGQRIVENNLRYTWAAVENAFLTYLVSHGLVGFSAFLLLFILYWGLLLKARHGSRDDPFIYFYSEALVLGMVGYAVANLFGAWLLFAIPMVTLFWFYMGMAGSLYNIYRDEVVPVKEAKRPILLYGVSPGHGTYHFPPAR
ncbi:MAG: O-antigen ligase family protein [Actinobacteria bacterium]|nr:O-antigen ligase family protein [Actinomycetota bacterium]MDI6831174.1 O-antigen ligase family protein [Actinomycetota bacterium]